MGWRMFRASPTFSLLPPPEIWLWESETGENVGVGVVAGRGKVAAVGPSSSSQEWVCLSDTPPLFFIMLLKREDDRYLLQSSKRLSVPSISG